MIQRPRKSGFTIVELLFAMSFIAILLLSIAMISIQASRIYNRGLILRSINHAGRDISDALRRDFLQADQQQVSQSEDDDSSVIILQAGGEEMGGRVCLGNVSYIWNSPKVLDGEIAPNESTTTVSHGTTNEVVNFIRVADVGGEMCKKQDDRYPTRLNETLGITNLLKRQSDEGEVVIGVHSLDIQPVDRADSRSDGLFKISYTLGTSRLSEINTADQSCKPPNDYDSNLEFCAINQFNIIARTNG